MGVDALSTRNKASEIHGWELVPLVARNLLNQLHAIEHGHRNILVVVGESKIPVAVGIEVSNQHGFLAPGTKPGLTLCLHSSHVTSSCSLVTSPIPPQKDRSTPSRHPPSGEPGAGRGCHCTVAARSNSYGRVNAYSLGGLQNVSSAVVSAAAMDGNNGGWPVLYGANPVAGSLELAFDEDQVNDAERNHTSEQVAYLAFGTMPEPSAGPFLERVVVNNVGTDSWTSVNLAHTYDSLVAVCSPNYDASQPPLVVRMRNATANSFEVRVGRFDGSTGNVSGIALHCAAVEEGVYDVAIHGVSMEAVKYTSTVTDRKGSWSGEARGYANAYSAPVVVGQVMTHNDARPSVFWTRGTSNSAPPSSSALFTGKHVGEDPSFDRTDETIGYIVIESGSGAIDGVSYQAGLGADTVRGVTTAPPYSYGLTGLSTTSAAIVSQAAMDGGDGGWAVLYGPNALTPSNLSLAIDEDQLGNSERAHSTEQVGFLIFE